MVRWANVPLPEPHLGGLAVGILLHLFFPWRLLPAAWIGHAIGWPLAAVAVALIGWQVAAAADVRLDDPDRLVVRGPYARSRNPMYVAWTVLYAGIALVVNTAWPMVLLPAVLALIHIGVLREERALERRFGEQYAAYRRRTRRYL